MSILHEGRIARQCVGYDGTPNESVEDVLVRVRQALSIMETQYDEGTVVIVAPDSNVLSILQAALLGVDLRDHWGLEYRCAHGLACGCRCCVWGMLHAASLLSDAFMHGPADSQLPCISLHAQHL